MFSNTNVPMFNALLVNAEGAFAGAPVASRTWRGLCSNLHARLQFHVSTIARHPYVPLSTVVERHENLVDVPKHRDAASAHQTLHDHAHLHPSSYASPITSTRPP